jgi:hypothetical protein
MIMKKAIFVLAILILISTAVTAQYIPFTNTTRIFDLDTGNVMKFYKVPLPQAGYKNFYVQRGGVSIPPYNYDLRYGNMLRYIYSANDFSDVQHNNRFHNSWTFQYGYNLGYVLDFSFSVQDTNLFLYAYSGANWEPADYTAISFNNGLSINQVFLPALSPDCGGVAIDPVNDSIMYAAFANGPGFGNVNKTTNRGANWFCTDTILNVVYDTKLFINKFNRNTIFISKGTDLYRSTTSGTDFQVIKTGVSGIGMFFDASDNTIYMRSNTAEGFSKSTNNGTNWTTLLNKSVNDFEFDPLNSNIVYAGCTDGLYKSINKGSTWTLYNNSFMPDVNVKGIVKNPNTGDTLFVSTGKAVYKVYGPSITDTSATNYFPLSVGNIYVYQYYAIPLPPSRHKVRITKDTVVAGKRFFYFYPALPGFTNTLYSNWLRIDGNTGVVTSLKNGYNCNYLVNETSVDSLKSRKNDTLRKCGLSIKSICFDTSNTTIFGIATKKKSYREDGIVLYERTYSKYFGISSVYSWEIDGGTDNLIGCKINGVTYGDTLLTGVEVLTNEVPSSYSLSQNYPNPFNPTTKIKFDVARLSNVNIIIYDLIGREVQTLVNERLQTGTYETTFDGSQLTSGVYFYKLTTDGFTETKRMVIIK